MKVSRRRAGFASLLLAALLLLAFAACESSAPGTAGTENTGKAENRTLELDLSGFTVIRSDLGGKEETDVALQLRRDISESCGIDLQIQTDWVKRGEEVPTDTAEILIGGTNRREDDTLRLGEWSITREGNRIYILAGSANALAEAEAHFAENYLLSGGCSLKDGFTERHECEYPVKSVSVGGKELNKLKICTVGGLADGYADRLVSLLGEKAGLKAEIVSAASKSDVVFTNQDGFSVENGCWGVSVTDGKLYIVGRTKVEMKKAGEYILSLVAAADETLDFNNESGKAYMHSEKQMTAEEYRLQKQLVIYPEYPEMINRNYDYAVTVTMDKETRSVPVYDHEMESRVKSRALNGDLHRRFCQFAFSGGQVRVDIRVKQNFKSYSVAPSAKAFKTEFKDGVISVWLDKPDYFLVMLDDDLNSIVAVFADYPEFPDELPDRNDPNVLFVDGVYKTDNGLLEIPNRDYYTIYIAPGAVLNCRVKISGKNVSVIGRGAIVDPFENIYTTNIEIGGTEGKGFKMLTMSGTDTLIEGIVFLDARCFNVHVSGSNNVIRDIKILSTMMTSDGITHYASDSVVEHCYIYNGDNSIVIGGVRNVTVSDVMIGTTCSAIFPQGAAKNFTLNDIWVFRVGEGIINAAYNPNENEYTMDFTFNNLDLTDITYLPYYFRGTKMRQTEKHFVFNNSNAPVPTGTADPHISAASRTKGTNYFFIFTDSGANNPTDNFVLDFRNLYLDGKPVSSADQLDNSAKTKNNPMTFTNDGTYTPPKKNAQTVNWTAPDRVYAGTLQLIFKGEVKKDGTTWLLPADEIRTFLRKPDAKVTTVKKDGADYIRSTDLVSAGMAKAVAEKDGALVITPVYNGENLFLPDSGEISRWTELTCYQVDLVTEKDADGLYYSLRNIKGSGAGLTRYFQDEAKMYGAGKYKLTFRIRAEAACRVAVGYATEAASVNKSCSVGTDWTEYTYDITVTEEEAATAISVWFTPNVTPYTTRFDIRDISLVRVGDK